VTELKKQHKEGLDKILPHTFYKMFFY